MRPAEDRDWKALPAFMAELHNYVAAMYEFLPSWDSIKAEYVPQMQEKTRAKDGAIYVAENANQLIGFVTYWIEQSDDLELKPEHQRYGYVKDIYVSPGAQGSGAGRMLMDTALDHFRARNLKVVQLHVLTQNEEALKFYDRLGFKNGALAMMKEL